MACLNPPGDLKARRSRKQGLRLQRAQFDASSARPSAAPCRRAHCVWARITDNQDTYNCLNILSYCTRQNCFRCSASVSPVLVSRFASAPSQALCISLLWGSRAAIVLVSCTSEQGVQPAAMPRKHDAHHHTQHARKEDTPPRQLLQSVMPGPL